MDTLRCSCLEYGWETVRVNWRRAPIRCYLLCVSPRSIKRFVAA